jgi:hypothetical protein
VLKSASVCSVSKTHPSNQAFSWMLNVLDLPIIGIYILSFKARGQLQSALDILLFAQVKLSDESGIVSAEDRSEQRLHHDVH